MQSNNNAIKRILIEFYSHHTFDVDLGAVLGQLARGPALAARRRRVQEIKHVLVVDLCVRHKHGELND